MEEPQSKRKRRPSVRLGEIGFAGPYDASELWLEAPRQRKKSSEGGVSKGKAKAPRIRPLGDVAMEEKTVVDEDWSGDEPAVASADEEKVAAEGEHPAGAPVEEHQHVKRRSGLTTRKPTVNTRVRGKGAGGVRLAWTGSKVRGSRHEEGTRLDPPVDAHSPENREDEEGAKDPESLPSQADDEAPFLAGTTSDSEELMGSGLKGDEDGPLPADDSGNGASDGSDEGDAGVNPNSNGDEMQGAIEDGPGQANGKGFSTVKQLREGERRSGRQAALRSSASRDTASRDTEGEPSGRFQAAATVANIGTIVVTPASSSQRVALSAGVSGWLQDLGLGKYSELFELNEVDTEVLPLLTMDDLREMGVDAVGARRKMFTNILELGQLRGA